MVSMLLIHMNNLICTYTHIPCQSDGRKAHTLGLCFSPLALLGVMQSGQLSMPNEYEKYEYESMD